MNNQEQKTYRVYKIECMCCMRVYVGSTTRNLSQRLAQHRHSARNNVSGDMYEHMREVNDYSNFRISLLEEAKGNREAKRACENKHMLILDVVRNGFNKRYELAKCQHGRRRNQCIECGGSQVCPHKRRQNNCIECGGSQVCEHKRQRNKCKDCTNYYCQWCDRKYSGAQALTKHRRSRKHLTRVAEMSAMITETLQRLALEAEEE